MSFSPRYSLMADPCLRHRDFILSEVTGPRVRGPMVKHHNVSSMQALGIGRPRRRF